MLFGFSKIYKENKKQYDMKVFEKISASRTPVNEKSVKVGDLWFNKEKIFTKKDIEEIIDFISKNIPRLLGGNVFQTNDFAHLFGNNNTSSKRFIFVLSCLRDEEGHPVFDLKDVRGITTIKSVGGIIKSGKDTTKNGGDKPKNKELVDILKNKFNLTELRKIAKNNINGVRAKDVKGMKESPLIKLIVDKIPEKDIKKLLGL